MLADAAISHLFKLQSIVTLFICEAKYVAMCKVKKEVVWLEYLLAELRFWKWYSLVTLYTDNQGSIVLSNNFKFHWCTKNINIRFY